MHTGKQNHRGKRCGRAFVLTPGNSLIIAEQRTLIRTVTTRAYFLARDLPCDGRRATVALALYERTIPGSSRGSHRQATSGMLVVLLQRLEAELDKLWSFVGTKANRHWVWIAMDATTRQVLAFHVGDRSGLSAQALWEKIPAVYQKHAVFYTDHSAAYSGVSPVAQHHSISKLARTTNHVERFNCTLRQRGSRLARATLSFSKKLSNHIGAIKYCICDYTLNKCAALPD